MDLARFVHTVAQPDFAGFGQFPKVSRKVTDLAGFGCSCILSDLAGFWPDFDGFYIILVRL